MHYKHKVKFHTQKSRILLKLLPEFQTSHSIIRAEAVSKIWNKPNENSGKFFMDLKVKFLILIFLSFE